MDFQQDRKSYFKNSNFNKFPKPDSLHPCTDHASNDFDERVQSNT